MKNKTMGFSTLSIHGKNKTPNQFKALASPIYQTSTFVFESPEQGKRRFLLEEDGYIYTRLGNPSFTEVEEKIAALEKGEACVSTSSGMGAITSAIWTLISQGDHIVASKTMYGCTFAFLAHGVSRFGVDVTFVDTRDPEAVEKAMRPNTKILYVETPANPNLFITDIEAMAKIAHKTEGCVLMVDNTFCSPYITQPITLGADVVVHSATKYLNGHGDVIAGFVVGKKDYITNVRFFGVKDITGANAAPFDTFLINRGLKTLSIRMDRHCANAMKIAEFLEQHPKIEKVIYPGLKSFPQYELAKKQMKLPGGMIAFEVKGGLEAGTNLMKNISLMSLAVSLGDAETLIEHPASMTHSAFTPEEREAIHLAEGLVRLSVGLEDVEDIIADLDNALSKI